MLSIFKYWGIWPATVMVCAQWEVFRQSGWVVPGHISLLTFSGTCILYGLDRLLEKRFLDQTASRHQPRARADLLLGSVFVVVSAWAAMQLNQAQILWIGILGSLGLVYLGTTIGKLPSFYLLKEILGSACFAWLAWGLLPLRGFGPPIAFLLMGSANFLWSSHQDRDRDQRNGLQSLAVSLPRPNLMLARFSAALAAALFFSFWGPNASLAWVALCHAAWPAGSRLPIDLAFLPLLPVLGLAFLGGAIA